MLPQQVERTKKGVCEVCPKEDVVLYLTFGNMWMCLECRDKEIKLQAEHQSPENQQKRVDELIARSREVDNSIQLKSDLFNAQTVAIVELKAAIENNAQIPVDKKQFALVEELMKRFLHLKEVIFEKRQELLEKENEQRAIQVHIQSLAQKLRAEERERLKLENIEYQPKPAKVVKPKAVTTPKQKYSKGDLRDAAAKYNVPEFALQMLVVQKNMTPEQAGQTLSDAMHGKKN